MPAAVPIRLRLRRGLQRRKGTMASAAQDTAPSYEAPSIADLGSFVDLTLGASQNKKIDSMGNSSGPA
jgi:hypothetical protein